MIFHDDIDFADGSSAIDGMHGLSRFNSRLHAEQDNKRAKLMRLLERKRREAGRGVLIGRHLVFWEYPKDYLENVGVEAEWETYTHIVYLQVDAEVIQQRRTEEKTKDRGMGPKDPLLHWQA